MTTPTPPTPPLDPVVAFTHKLRDKADLILGAHRVVIFLLLCAFAFAGYEGWQWHLAALARLEAQASIEKTKATNEHKLGESWKARAIARTDSVKHDTVRVDSIVYRTKSFTAPVTVAAPDGTTSVVPMQVVAKADFDSLGAACERIQHDCASALAAKDSVIAHDSLQAVALGALSRNVGKQLTSVKRASVFQKVVWGLIGLAIGRASKL